MYLTETHIIDKNHSFYNECDNLCFKAKNLYNIANYHIRQEFIETSKQKNQGSLKHANYLNYYDINRLMIDSNQFDYRELPSKVSNQILRLVDKNYVSFFKAVKEYKKNPDKFKTNPKLPKYKHKTNGRFVVPYELGSISKTELKKGFVKLSGTNIKLPFINKEHELIMVRIVPMKNKKI